jgi:hypothetical protein
MYPKLLNAPRRKNLCFLYCTFLSKCLNCLMIFNIELPFPQIRPGSGSRRPKNHGSGSIYSFSTDILYHFLIIRLRFSQKVFAKTFREKLMKFCKNCDTFCKSFHFRERSKKCFRPNPRWCTTPLPSWWDVVPSFSLPGKMVNCPSPFRVKWWTFTYSSWWVDVLPLPLPGEMEDCPFPFLVRLSSMVRCYCPSPFLVSWRTVPFPSWWDYTVPRPSWWDSTVPRPSWWDEGLSLSLPGEIMDCLSHLLVRWRTVPCSSWWDEGLSLSLPGEMKDCLSPLLVRWRTVPHSSWCDEGLPLSLPGEIMDCLSPLWDGHTFG